MTKYTDFLKQWASSKDLSYMCARDQPEFKQAWNAQKSAPKVKVKVVKPPKPPKLPKPPKEPKQPKPKSVPIRQPKPIPVAKQPKTQKTNPKLPFNNALAERLEELEKPPEPYIPLMSVVPEMNIIQKRLQPFTRSISPSLPENKSPIVKPMPSLAPIPINLFGTFFKPREQEDRAGWESDIEEEEEEVIESDWSEPLGHYEPLLNIYPSDQIRPKKLIINRPPPPQPTVFKQSPKFIEPMPVLNEIEYIQHPDLEEGEIYEEPPSAEELKALNFQKWKKDHRVAWTNSVYEDEYGHHSTWDEKTWIQYNKSVDSDIQWDNGNPAERFPNQYKKIRKRHSNIKATESEEEEEAEEARKKKQEEEDAFWNSLEKAQDLVERHGEEKAKKMMEKDPELVATHVIKRAYKKKDKDAPPPPPKRAYNWKKAEKNKAFLKEKK